MKPVARWLVPGMKEANSVAELIDISAGGMRTRSPVEIPAGIALRLDFALEGADAFEDMKATVLSSRKADSGAFFVQLSFSELTGKPRDRLLAWVAKQTTPKRRE